MLNVWMTFVECLDYVIRFFFFENRFAFGNYHLYKLCLLKLRKWMTCFGCNSYFDDVRFVFGNYHLYKLPFVKTQKI